MIYSNPDIEFCPLHEIETFQNDLLHKALAYLKANSPFYQRMFRQYNIEIDKKEE